MNTLIHRTTTAIFVLLLLQACASTQNPAIDSARTSVSGDQTRIEGFFVAPGHDFSRYRRLILTDLQLDNVNMVQSAGKPSSRPTLSENDQRFYRAAYTAAVVDHLIADGTYGTALDPADDVFVLTAAIAQITAPASGGTTASARMQSYVDGVNTVTIVIEIRNSLTQQLIATFTETRDFGRMVEENSRSALSAQTRAAFNDWLAFLRKELDALSGR